MHLERRLREKPAYQRLRAVEQRHLAIEPETTAVARSEQERVGDVEQLAPGPLGIAKLLGHRERGCVQLPGALVVEARVAVDPKPVGDLEPRPAHGQPVERENALRRELRGERQLAQAGRVRRREARRLDGELLLAGPLEELERTLGVGNDVRRAPLVRAQARPAHEEPPTVGSIRSARKRPVDLILTGVTFRWRRRAGGTVVESVEVECHLAPDRVSAAARRSCTPCAGNERVSGPSSGSGRRAGSDPRAPRISLHAR